MGLGNNLERNGDVEWKMENVRGEMEDVIKKEIPLDFFLKGLFKTYKVFEFKISIVPNYF